MCDKKNTVLFTDTKCVVLSPDFKLLDESQVLLKVPRNNNMYSFDFKNVLPIGGLTCLFTKATLDESNLWHRRLGHINFKIMNKLVRGNLVRGLPSKLFENDHTCVAFQNGKQHKASNKVADDPGKKNIEVSRKENEVKDPAKEGEAANTNSTNRLNTISSLVNDVSSSFTTVDPGRAQRNEFESMFGQDKNANSNRMFTLVSAAGFTYINLGRSIPVNVATLPNADFPTDLLMPDLEDVANLQDTRIFSGAYDDKVKGVVANFNNLELTTVVSPISTTRIHKDHLKEQIIRDPLSAPQTRIMTKTSQEHTMDEAIRLFLSYASFMGFIVYQMDVKSAFLYGTIEEEVYVCQPLGFDDPHFPNKVYKIEKALYGLHQAPRPWYEALSTYLLENRFRRGIIDKTLFIKKDKGDLLLVQVYVDDIIFRLMIGSLMYLTTSRPDIMFDVCACARFQVTPKVSHLHAMKRIIRYIKGQPKLGLWYPKDSPFDLEAFSDSDYAGASLDKKSTT
nr:hypothetical protein [Tanacetum cinerariifolium]